MKNRKIRKKKERQTEKLSKRKIYIRHETNNKIKTENKTYIKICHRKVNLTEI